MPHTPTVAPTLLTQYDSNRHLPITSARATGITNLSEEFWRQMLELESSGVFWCVGAAVGRIVAGIRGWRCKLQVGGGGVAWNALFAWAI